MPTTLAQIINEQVEHTVVFWGVILILASIVLFIIIAVVKKRMLDSGSSKGPDAGFSLSDLRAMRDRGEITPDEYEQTRARVIAKVKGRKAAAAKAEEEAAREEAEEDVAPGEPKEPEEGDGGTAGDHAGGGDSEG